MGIYVRVCRCGGSAPVILNNLTLRVGESEKKLLEICSKRLHAPCKYFKILKKSLDARDKSAIRWVYSVECDSRTLEKPPRSYAKVNLPAPKVMIAGAGPAGLFCAYRLIRHGIRPVLIERGKPVEEREKDIRQFFETGVLDPDSNVQFGEGGAGTFSDGKLNTQTNTPLNREVLDIFLEFGAPEEVGYLGKPHVGSDNLKKVVANLRRYILENGGEIRYGSLVNDFEFKDGKLSAVKINGEKEPCDLLVLAIGHSARDTFERLLERGFHLEQKEFAVGVRIEHLQSEVGRAQYGADFESLPAADYKLVSHAAERAAFSFCMCPGGVVIPSASEEGGVVTNGMSNFARDGVNANSALVVQVKREDFGSEHPLAGIAFQRKLERAAFEAAGRDYKAPVQLVGDFLEDRESVRFGDVLPTYARGTAFVPMKALFPTVFVETMKSAIPDMNRRLSGFAAHDGILTGVESRTSSPVRLLRGDDLQAVGKEGVYPCGEGCGYAGGIMSAAADGLRVAAAIAIKYTK